MVLFITKSVIYSCGGCFIKSSVIYGRLWDLTAKRLQHTEETSSSVRGLVHMYMGIFLFFYLDLR